MNSIQELLEDLGIEYATHGQSKHVSQGWTGLVCPWCDQGQGNFGLGVNLSRGTCSCYGCGPKRLGDVLAAMTNRPLKECIALADSVRTGYQSQLDETIRRGTLKMPINSVYGGSPPHERYLKGRGFDLNRIEFLWNLKYTRHDSNHPWRIVWPVELYGKVLSWTSRSIGNKEGYWSAKPKEEILPYKSLLLGEDAVRHVCICVEGPMDAMAIGCGAVCTFGVGYTRAQVNRLSAFPKRILVFDSDQAGKRAATKLADELAPLGGKTIVVELDAADPGSASRMELLKLRRLAFGKADIGEPGKL